MHRTVTLCLALLAQSTALTVGVTGAGGKTGSLCYQQLAADSRVDAAIPFVRDASSKKTLKVHSNTPPPAQFARAHAPRLRPPQVLPDAPLVEADVTGSASAFAAVLKENKVDALLIATSAVPQIKKRSIAKVLLLKLIPFVKGGRPEFRFRPGGTPEEVDWVGQKAQIDAAKEAGVKHVVICSSMGGTQPQNFLNTIGQQADGSGGQILLWKRKAEQYLVDSGLTYTILHPGGLTDKEGGLNVVMDVDDVLLTRLPRNIPRADVASLMCESLFCDAAKGRSVDVISAGTLRAGEGPAFWDGYLGRLFGSTAGNADYSKPGKHPTPAPQ